MTEPPIKYHGDNDFSGETLFFISVAIPVKDSCNRAEQNNK